MSFLRRTGRPILQQLRVIVRDDTTLRYCTDAPINMRNKQAGKKARHVSFIQTLYSAPEFSSAQNE